jgi:hypothetical protein
MVHQAGNSGRPKIRWSWCRLPHFTQPDRDEGETCAGGAFALPTDIGYPFLWVGPDLDVYVPQFGAIGQRCLDLNVTVMQITLWEFALLNCVRYERDLTPVPTGG